jgi:hypothetical protein
MPLPQPASISGQAGQILAQLLPFAESAGGAAEVVSNLQMLWKQAAMDTQKPRILICYNGESIRGEFATAAINHRVDRQWIVAVTRGRGWTAQRGSSLFQAVGNADAFYDVVEQVRDLIRRMLGISEEFPVDFKRISPMSSQNKALDSYAIEFSTASDIPAITYTNPDQPGGNTTIIGSYFIGEYGGILLGEGGEVQSPEK